MLLCVSVLVVLAGVLRAQRGADPTGKVRQQEERRLAIPAALLPTRAPDKQKTGVGEENAHDAAVSVVSFDASANLAPSVPIAKYQLQNAIADSLPEIDNRIILDALAARFYENVCRLNLHGPKVREDLLQSIRVSVPRAFEKPLREDDGARLNFNLEGALLRIDDWCATFAALHDPQWADTANADMYIQNYNFHKEGLARAVLAHFADATDALAIIDAKFPNRTGEMVSYFDPVYFFRLDTSDKESLEREIQVAIQDIVDSENAVPAEFVPAELSSPEVVVGRISTTIRACLTQSVPQSFWDTRPLPEYYQREEADFTFRLRALREQEMSATMQAW